MALTPAINDPDRDKQLRIKKENPDNFGDLRLKDEKDKQELGKENPDKEKGKK